MPALGITAFMTGASTVIMGTLPLLIGYFADRLRLDWLQIGWFGAAGQAGTLTGMLLAYWLIERGMLRTGLQAGAVVALVFSLLTAASETFPMLLSWRALTAAGVGCVFAIGTYVLSRSALPARNFSIMSGVQVACGSAHAVMLPWLYAHFGHVVAVSSVALWFAMILLLSFRASIALNADPAQSAPRPASGHGLASRLRGALLLGAVLAFQTSVVVIWIYSERLATAAGLPREHIAAAIALGNLGGVPASLIGVVAGERFGHLPIVLLATISIICGELLIFVAPTTGAYAAGQFVFNFGWLLGVSYYLGMLAKHDFSGRMIRLAPPALVIAGALGPMLAASLTTRHSPASILFLSLSCCIVALVLAMAGASVQPQPIDGCCCRR